MKRILLIILVLLTLTKTGKADHISGGEVYYTVTDLNNGSFSYRITVRLFMVCNSGRQFINPSVISVFSKSTGTRIKDIPVPLAGEEVLSLTNTNKCITDPPIVCYNVGLFEFEVTLPASPDGYYITCQVVFRINGISNLIANYGNIGATYTAEIPGNAVVGTASKNNSARFTGSDMVVVCAFNSFSYSFAASDSDGDELRYSFCHAYQGGNGGGFGNSQGPPLAPPYSAVPYGSNFSGSNPLGSNVKIDSRTGLITGVAPSPGVYVVTVCVEEIRNGVVIATQRKDLQINITSCTIASATIPPEYMLCKDSKEISLINLSNSPLINTYNWELIDSKGESLFTSTSSTVKYTFADTGLYKIKLVINRDGSCSDSTISVARVYPGFFPDFDVNGICVNRPTVFNEKSRTAYGTVDKWDWDFGEGSLNDFSDKQHPDYTYATTGSKEVRMVAGNSKGCIDTVRKSIAILDKPPLDLLFKDTLICKNDVVQFVASARGKYSWSPQINLDDPNNSSPKASPLLTTTYYVDVDDEGCANRDSVKVRVTDKVSLDIMHDTITCAGDPVQIRVRSDAFRYTWSPSFGLDNVFASQPVSSATATSTYNVFAQLGGCVANSAITIRRVPYPLVNAGPDTMICFNTSARLHGQTNGSKFTWSPLGNIQNSSSLNPMVTPKTTMSYVLTATDSVGCPKPARDSVRVQVLPQIHAFAGRDTAVIVGQPLQLNAVGGIRYSWSPSFGLSSPDIADPVANLTAGTQGIRYKVNVFNEAGCVDTASIMVKVFTTSPSVFAPNAFTPNRDGKNDLFKIVTAGISKVEYVRLYNRWGQLVYSFANSEGGWDGTIGGKESPSGTFVYMIRAIDYTGTAYTKKGTVVLLR